MFSYDFDYTWVFRNVDVLLYGLLVTLGLTGATILLGIGTSIPLMLLRRSRFWPLSWSGRIIIEVFRDTPVLVILIWMFYCLPIFLGSSLRLSPFWLATIGLGLNFAALHAEILRSGFDAIPRDQLESAHGLGFSRLQQLRYILLPQAVWRSIPPTLGQVINTIKLTSLASFIAVNELFFVTNKLIQDTFRPLEFYTTLALLYLIVIVPLALSVQSLETKLNKRFTSD